MQGRRAAASPVYTFAFPVAMQSTPRDRKTAAAPGRRERANQATVILNDRGARIEREKRREADEDATSPAAKETGRSEVTAKHVTTAKVTPSSSNPITPTAMSAVLRRLSPLGGAGVRRRAFAHAALAIRRVFS